MAEEKVQEIENVQEEENIQEETVQEELKALAKKQLNWTRTLAITAIAAFALLLVAFCLVVPKTVELIDVAGQEITHAGEVIDEAGEALENVNKIDFDSLAESVSNLTGFINGIANIFK